ncbi:MAG: LamB/YcsF family protein [Thalassovita sp.]
MSKTIDLNADMGESFGSWSLGDDTALLDIVSSANIACGFHAGDPDVMAKVMANAVGKNVGMGAHPGLDDLRGFGRYRMHVPHATLANQVRYQIGAAQAMARAAGGEIRHLKLHGALANMAADDQDLARACYEAALSVAPDLYIMVIAATAQQRAAVEIGAKWVGEIFADRAYNDDATLVDRALPGAVIHDAAIAGPRMARMICAGAIITESGKHIETQIDTICLHGDTPEAVEIAKSVRTALLDDGISIAAFGR